MPNRIASEPNRIASEQPSWCCNECGKIFGRWYIDNIIPAKHMATYHRGTCDVCGKSSVSVTEPRDFGYLTSGWDEQKKHRYARTHT